MYYELQNSLQVGTSAIFALSATFLVIMSINDVSTKD